jgi:hypothetical protein
MSKMYKLVVEIIGCELEGRFPTATGHHLVKIGSKAEMEAEWDEIRAKILKCPSKKFKGFRVKMIEC